MQNIVDHSPRRSSKETKLVDNLSRADTSTKDDIVAIGKAKENIFFVFSQPLPEWCENPSHNVRSLSYNIVDYVISKFSANE